MPKKHLSNEDIHFSFRSAYCRCGGKKWENSAFCPGCFDDLSLATQKGLSQKFGDGFESAYRQACRELDGDDGTEEVVYFE